MPKGLSTLIIPALIISLAAYCLPRLGMVPPEHRASLAYLPYLMGGAGLLLGLHFRRGRLTLALAMLLFAHFLAESCLAGGLTTPQSSLVYRAMAIVLPFNLLLLTIMREKGTFTSVGRLRLLVLGAELAIVWFSIKYHYYELWENMTSPIVRWQGMEGLVAPQQTVILLLMAMAVALWRGLNRNSPLDGGMAGVAVSSFVLLNWLWVPQVPLVFTSASALILIVAVLRDSHNMAFCDDLTGLPSRRALNEDLRGMGRRYALAMVDVDHFKKFNDTHGHDVGDQVLRMVASRLQRVSGGGRPYRYGGEEFTIIFPGKDAKGVLTHLETLRKDIADYRMTLRGGDRPADDEAGRNRRAGRGADHTVSVTVSMGLADAGEGGASPEQVLKAADRALYRAKSRGRNQVSSTQH